MLEIIEYILAVIGSVAIGYHVTEFVKARIRKRKKFNCPNCHRGVLVQIRSQFIKKCSSCAHEVVWNLDRGQKPLLGSNRSK